MNHNRTSASIDYAILTIILAFLTVLLAYITILPGLRKKRFTSLCIISLSLLSGLTIFLGKYGSCWHVGQGEINTSYKAFSKQRINAALGIRIGLVHMNVTLQVMPKDDRDMDVNFNEQFIWEKPTDMRDQYKQALVKGLPYPILTVAEHFKLNTESFGWGFNYRSAGYYANIALTAALVSWILMNIMLVNIPRYGAYLMAVTGSLLCFSAVIYVILMPSRPLLIRFEDTIISFHFGWCFYLVLVIGVLQASIGLVISLLDLMFPHTFSTILEVDFDTPFDRHILIQDSEDTRKRARALKLPNVQKSIRQRLTTGSRYLRRLSTKRNPAGSRRTPAAFYNNGFDPSPAPAVKKNSTSSNTKSVRISGDVPEISIDIHHDNDMLKRDLNVLDSLPECNETYPDVDNLRKISSESAASAASGSSEASTSSAASARTLSFDISTSVPLDNVEVEDTLSKLSDDSETESDSESEENVNVIKIHQTDERGQILSQKSQIDRSTLHITWQEELVIDNEDPLGINDSENEGD